MEDRDVVIVGGGPAGYTAAIRTVQLGGKATLIERDAIGGVCLNHGCIPTVALARAAELLDLGKNASDYGISFKGMEVDFQKMMSKKESVVRTLVSGVKQMLEAYGVEVLQGTGRLLSPSVLEVRPNEGSKRELKARKIILSPGSRYPKPAFGGVGERVINPMEGLRLKAIPESIVIVGGGVIGTVLATIFSRLGARVTIVEESQRLLTQVDREIVTILEKEFKDSNVQMHFKSRIVDIAADEKHGVGVVIERRESEDRAGEKTKFETRYVLMSEGREANVEGLGLPEAGVRINGKGGIEVNRQMETSVSGIYAAGDVTMEHLWTSAAYFEATSAAENAMGKSSTIQYRAIPCWARSIPEVASVGMTEEEAAAAGHKIRVGRFPFAGNGMAAILGQRTGIVKVIKEERYGEILGVHMIGPRAGDLIAEAALAMRMEGTPGEIAGTFHVHPSLSETLWEAARGV